MAPEHPYPIPTDDCFTAYKYVLQNPLKFNADLDRLVIAGDSAGGDATSVVMSRIIKENFEIKPKIQVLIYPWLQKFYTKLPSQNRYGFTGVLDAAKLSDKYICWYMGFKNINASLLSVFRNNEILTLIDNEAEKKFIMDCLDVQKIPKIFKPDESFYKKNNQIVIPTSLPETSLLKKRPELAKQLKKIFNPDIAPLLTPKEILTAMPKTYLTVFEWDTLKDEGLLYAERLKDAGVDVHVAYYTEAFHGMALLTQAVFGFQEAREIREDLINYLSKNL